MPRNCVFNFLRKARQIWFSGEEKRQEELEADAAGAFSSVAASETRAKGDVDAQNESAAAPGLSCMGMIECNGVVKEKLENGSGREKQERRLSSERNKAFRMSAGLCGRQKVRVLPEAETMASSHSQIEVQRDKVLPSAASNAALDEKKEVVVVVAAPRPRRKQQVNLWKRRTMAESPQLQINDR